VFEALLITQPESGYRCELTQLDEAQLPASGDVTVRVDCSTINYKDGLAITGKSPVVRSFPMVPGIDFAGSVTQSDHPKWKAGDRVLLNGFGVGETHWGGLSQMARVKGDWLVALPDTLSERDAMSLGTAGYTAMLCVQALQKHWADAGVAATGRPQEADYLKSLGAASVIDRNDLSAPGKPLQKERWIGVVDSVGSHTLANACASTRYGGAVAACGLAQGMDLPASVAPFILRGITLYGIDSVMAPMAQREAAWDALAKTINREQLASITTEIALPDAIAAGSQILAGQVRGRLVVKLKA